MLRNVDHARFKIVHLFRSRKNLKSVKVFEYIENVSSGGILSSLFIYMNKNRWGGAVGKVKFNFYYERL